MDKKKLLALLIFLIMGFFMVSFANPSDQLTPVDTGTQESTDNNANQTNVNPTRNTTTDTRTNQTVATNATPVQTNDTIPVVDDNTPSEVGNVDIQEYTVRFVDYANNVLKSQTVEEHASASASDITVEDYTVANITYSFTKWDKDFSDVTSNMTVKALYDVKKIIAHVYINGKLVDETVEIKVNDDTKDKKDIKLTNDNIDDYIVNIDELPEVKPGKENEVEKLTYDEEEGYIVEINENDIDYTITGANGALVNGKEEIIAHIGDEVTLSHVEKEGYDFEYYMVQDGDTIYIVEGTEITVNTDDVTVTAVYSKITYTIEYVLNGGSVSGNPTEYTVESDDITLNNPTKEGYTFDGWTLGNERPVKNVVIKKGSTGDRVYTAHFTARNDIKYTVERYTERLNATSDEDKYEYLDTIEYNNGTADKEKEIRVDAIEGFTTPASQTVEIAANGSTVVRFNYDRIERTVTFNVDNKLYSKETLKYGQAISIPNYTVSAGYTFSGWTNVATTMGTINLTYNATTTPITYTINYVLPQNATNASTNPTQYNITQTPITLSDASMTGYTFNGWTDEDGKTSIEANSYGDKTFTGSFTARNDIRYTVKVLEEKVKYTSEANRYEVVSTTTLNDGTADQSKEIVAPTAKTGFKQAANQTVTIAADGSTVVEFKYDRESYKATYTINNEYYTEQTYRYGQTIVKPLYSVAAGYTFSGWTVDTTMPAENKSYNATLTANENNTYIVKVLEKNLEGQYVENTSRRITVNNAKTDDELTITAPEASDGFKLNDEQTKSLTISATADNIVEFKYDRETYKVTYTVDSVYYTEQSYLYGQTIVKPNYTVAAGYTFSGWTNVATTMPAENLTYNATTTAKSDNTYIVKVMEEKLEGGYEENTSRRITVNNATTAAVLSIDAPDASTGFVRNANEPASKSLTISATTENVVEFKYDRTTVSVTFNYHEGSEVKTTKFGGSVVPPTIAQTYTENGYTFKFNSWDGKYTNVTQTEVVTAKYDADAIEYTLSYVLNGGQLAQGKTNPNKYTVEQLPLTINSPSKTGYNFTNWTDQNGNTYATSLPENTIGNKTLTANYSARNDIKYTVKVLEEKVTYTSEANKYEVVDTKTYNNGTANQPKEIIAPTAKTGFKQAANQTVTIAADGSTVVEFKYDRESYKATYTINNEYYTEQTYRYGETITKPSYTVAEGYNFTTWNVDATMPANNTSYNATLAIQTFTVKWEVNGQIVATETVNYNNKATQKPANPSLEGYTFLGWKDAKGNNETVAIKENTTFKAQLVTLTAKIKPNHQLSYTKSYNGNKPELVKDDITVTLVNLGGEDKVLKANEYTTDFDNTAFVKSKTLNITYTSGNLTLTNNKLRYSVIYLAYQSKFEVDVSIKNTYDYTKDDNCMGTDGQRCDEGNKVGKRTLSHNFLEITEHYNQFVQVQSATVKYTNGSTKTLNLSDRVRWSYVEEIADVSKAYVITGSVDINWGDSYPANTYVSDGWNGYNKASGECYNVFGCTYYTAELNTKDYSSNTKYYTRNSRGNLEKYNPEITYGYHDPVYIATKNNGNSDVMDNSHVIDTVTVRYHRDANAEDNETEGYFDVVFKYDPEVDGGFYCIDEYEVK